MTTATAHRSRGFRNRKTHTLCPRDGAARPATCANGKQTTGGEFLLLRCDMTALGTKMGPP